MKHEKINVCYEKRKNASLIILMNALSLNDRRVNAMWLQLLTLFLSFIQFNPFRTPKIIK